MLEIEASSEAGHMFDAWLSGLIGFACRSNLGSFFDHQFPEHVPGLERFDIDLERIRCGETEDGLFLPMRLYNLDE